MTEPKASTGTTTSIMKSLMKQVERLNLLYNVEKGEHQRATKELAIKTGEFTRTLREKDDEIADLRKRLGICEKPEPSVQATGGNGENPVRDRTDGHDQARPQDVQVPKLRPRQGRVARKKGGRT